MYFAHDTTDVISLLNAINVIPLLKKSRLITNLIAGRLENGLCGKVVYRQRPNDIYLIWQVYSKSKQFWCFTHESLWYRVRYFDVFGASWSTFAVQTMLTPDDLNTMCFTGGDSPKQMEVPSTGVCVNDEKRNYTVLGWREIMMSAQYPVRKCTFLSTSKTFASSLWPKEGVVAMTSPSNRQFNWL